LATECRLPVPLWILCAVLATSCSSSSNSDYNNEPVSQDDALTTPSGEPVHAQLPDIDASESPVAPDETPVLIENAPIVAEPLAPELIDSNPVEPTVPMVPAVEAGPDIYLLLGQSNMVGRGNDVDAEAMSLGLDASDARIRQLNVKQNLVYDTASLETFLEPFTPLSPEHFVVATDPLHEPLEPATGDKSGTEIGLGLTFAKAALKDGARDVVLVPAAYGGTGFCASVQKVSWNAQLNSNAEFGNDWLFRRAVRRANQAIEETGGALRGILWHQGESDSFNPVCAAAYQENLMQLVKALRTTIRVDALGPEFRGPDAKIPFVLGTMSRGTNDISDQSQLDESEALVDAAHRNVSSYLVHASAVNNDDLIPPAYPCGAGGCLHFGSRALREMGYRYYQQLQSIRDAP